MVEIRKKITVANDGFCNFKKSADERLSEKVDKYIAEKKENGWEIVDLFSGDAFSRKEAIVIMSKERR